MTDYDQAYKNQFDLLTFHTNEYEQSIELIESTIIPKLHQKQHFLDIGAGRGTISMPLSRHFEQTTIIEPNAVYFQEVIDWAKGANANIDGQNADWLEVDSRGFKADLTVVAHVLYFVDPTQRSEFLSKAFSTVKSGGSMIVIMISATSGINHLYRTLLSKQDYVEMPSIESVVVDLRAEGYDNMHLTMFDADIHLPKFEDMVELIDFLVVGKVEFNTDEMISKRNQYIEEFLKTDTNYTINSNIGVLSIFKP